MTNKQKILCLFGRHEWQPEDTNYSWRDVCKHCGKVKTTGHVFRFGPNFIKTTITSEDFH